MLLPPKTVYPRLESTTLRISKAECYPSTNVTDVTIYNPSDREFQGKVFLIIDTGNRREEVSHTIKIRIRREQRVAFDFAPGVCAEAAKLVFKSVPAY